MSLRDKRLQDRFTLAGCLRSGVTSGSSCRALPFDPWPTLKPQDSRCEGFYGDILQLRPKCEQLEEGVFLNDPYLISGTDGAQSPGNLCRRHIPHRCSVAPLLLVCLMGKWTWKTDMLWWSYLVITRYKIHGKKENEDSLPLLHKIIMRKRDLCWKQSTHLKKEILNKLIKTLLLSLLLHEAL